MRIYLLFCLACMLIFTSCNSPNGVTKKRIAIVTPVSHPSMEQIEKGFIRSIEKAHPHEYDFVTYNSHGNKTLMRSEIEEMAQQDFSLVFTIGTSTSQMTIEYFTKKRVAIPIVFTAVNDPEVLQNGAAKNSAQRIYTGVKELLQFDEELDHLLAYKPNVKKLLLVYNPAEPGLKNDQKQIQTILEERNIKLTTIEVFQSNELSAKVSPFIAEADAVLVIKDNTVVTGLDALIKLSNRYKIPLMASDLDSPDKGAAFGYGVYEVDFGIEGAKKALQILDAGIHPADIPLTPISNFILRMNKEAALKQGIDPRLIDQKRAQS